MKASYTGQGNVKTYTGKLIKVTEGSQLAIAPVNHPKPTNAKSVVSQMLPQFTITDSKNSQTTYYISGSNGNLTNCFCGLSYLNKVYITGQYTLTNNSIYHCWGTITRTDGTFQTFDIISDLT